MTVGILHPSTVANRRNRRGGGFPVCIPIHIVAFVISGNAYHDTHSRPIIVSDVPPNGGRMASFCRHQHKEMFWVWPGLKDSRTFLNPVSTTGLFFFQVNLGRSQFRDKICKHRKIVQFSLVGRPQSPYAALTGIIGGGGCIPENPLARGERKALLMLASKVLLRYFRESNKGSRLTPEKGVG